MATRREKVEAGLFLLIGAGLLFGVLFLLVGLNLTRERDSYMVHFESVGNLKQNSPVTFKGRPVGVVGGFELSHDQMEIVVELLLEKKTTITDKVKAELKVNPLTQSYSIELTLDEPGGKIVEPGGQIESKSSQFEEIVDNVSDLQSNLPELLAKVERVLERLNQLFSDENLENLSKILRETEALVAVLPAKVDRLESEALGLKAEVELKLNGVVAQVESMIVQLERVALKTENIVVARGRDVGDLLTELKKTARGAQELMKSISEDPSRIVWPERSKFDSLLFQIDRAISELRMLFKEIRKEPSRIIWSDRPAERKTVD